VFIAKIYITQVNWNFELSHQLTSKKGKNLMTEEELILRMQGGDETAFKEVVETYKDMVFNTALGLLQNYEDAEDISQEVFIKVYQCIRKFRHRSKFSTYLYQITVRKSLDFLKRKKRKKRYALIFRFFESEKDKSIPVDFVHPGISFENQEKAKILFQSIEKLPEKQKIVFILHNIEGLSYKEIAEVMGSSISSVESIIYRAKENLRKYLTKYYKSVGSGRE